MQLPLYIKFKANSNFYVFDSCTNEILQVSSLVYTIIDDFMVLGDNDIVQKYSSLYGQDVVCEVITALKQISSDRFLQTNYPQCSYIPLALCCNQNRYTFEEFLDNFSALLIVELTQKCNLDCSYCIYGKHYSRHQPRSTGSISSEIAEIAIRNHLEKSHSGRTITFYGGEPLLEFELMQHLILYAEQYCLNIGKESPSFSITTNGTLLNDQIIHFLVEHKCNILISVDGDRETHDKYRVYKGNREGSFNDVEKNLQRFVELYPAYERRGIILTITGSTDVRKANEFLKYHILSFPAIVVNFADSFLGVNPGMSTCDCDGNNCTNISVALNEQTCPDFLKRKIGNEKQWVECEQQFWSDVFTLGTQTKYKWPLFYYGFFIRMRILHQRKIKTALSGRVTCCCIPGSIRLYCDIDGNYYPCERVEFHDSFKIGNVKSGIDHKKVLRMVNYMSEVMECGKCVGKHLCSVCPAMIAEDDSTQYNDIRLKQHCSRISDDLNNSLAQYVSLLKSQPSFFPNESDYEQQHDDKEWTKHIVFLAKDPSRH